MGQQRETASLGMWVFLMTELLLFGALFISYTVFRLGSPAGFADAATRTDMRLGGLMTLVLITSSLTIALAVNAAKSDSRRLLLAGLALTIILGVVLLGMKFYEYHDHYVRHQAPGINFDYRGLDPHTANLFFFLYFAMTGLHAIHMIVGVCLISVMLFRAYRAEFSSYYYNPVEMSALYRHFVDVVWIFLFPLFYLIGRYH